MEATRTLPSCKLPPRQPRLPGGNRGGIVVRASRSRDEGGGSGRLVDESMIVLRLRIREMKMLEMKNNNNYNCYNNYYYCEEEGDFCDNWMEWEKKYYYGGDYGKDVCEAVGLLQCYLMSVRPISALGILVLMAMSLTLSSGFVLSQSLDMVKSLLSNFGLCY